MNKYLTYIPLICSIIFGAFVFWYNSPTKVAERTFKMYSDQIMTLSGEISDLSGSISLDQEVIAQAEMTINNAKIGIKNKQVTIAENQKSIERIQNCIDLKTLDCGKLISITEAVNASEANLEPSIEVPQRSSNVETSTGVQTKLENPSLKMMDKFGLVGCYLTNSDHELSRINYNWSAFAYDYGCDHGKPFNVSAPAPTTIEKIGFDSNLGNYIILRHTKDKAIRFVIGHTRTSRKVGESLEINDIIGQTVEGKNGASNGTHVHIEVWYNTDLVSYEFTLGKPYDKKSGLPLLEDRDWNFGQEKPRYFFTHYDPADIGQTDGHPCVGASGINICELEKKGIRTMALTKDIREKLGIKWGDVVRLEGDPGCTGTFQVHDEMNCRFRGTPCTYIKDGVTKYSDGNTKRGNFYIKGDISGKTEGACSVTKL